MKRKPNTRLVYECLIQPVPSDRKHVHSYNMPVCIRPQRVTDMSYSDRQIDRHNNQKKQPERLAQANRPTDRQTEKRRRETD